MTSFWSALAWFGLVFVAGRMFCGQLGAMQLGLPRPDVVGAGFVACVAPALFAIATHACHVLCFDVVFPASVSPYPAPK